MTERPVAPNEIETVVCLYDRHGPSMYRYALILLTDQAAAEDAVHEVFASVLRSGAIARLEADERYLRRAIRNACFSMLRAKRRWIQVEPGGLLERIPSADSKPDERLALEGGIRLLTRAQRETVHLHAFEGLTFREIAEASGTSPDTVAGRYRYALAKAASGARRWENGRWPTDETLRSCCDSTDPQRRGPRCVPASRRWRTAVLPQRKHTRRRAS